jgi:CspA family cold shock protein
MNVIVKIVVALVVAALATAITTWYSGDSHAALTLFVAFCAATLSTVLLVSLPFARPAATASRPARKAGTAARPAASRPAPRAQPAEGPRQQGKVKWFNVSKGFGFITKDDGEEIFVHFRSIRGAGRRGLRDGQRVTFIVADSDKGPQAEDVEGVD